VSAGRLIAESTERQGSCFGFSLPLELSPSPSQGLDASLSNKDASHYSKKQTFFDFSERPVASLENVVCGAKYMVGEEVAILGGSMRDERDEDRDGDRNDGRDENEVSDRDGEWGDGDVDGDGDRDGDRDGDERRDEERDRDRDNDGDERSDGEDDLLEDALPGVFEKSETLRSATSPSALSSRQRHTTSPHSTSFSPLSLSPLLPSALFSSPLPLSCRPSPAPLSKILIAGGKSYYVRSVLYTVQCPL
jgi:hypothetical protein